MYGCHAALAGLGRSAGSVRLLQIHSDSVGKVGDTNSVFSLSKNTEPDSIKTPLSLVFKSCAPESLHPFTCVSLYVVASV